MWIIQKNQRSSELNSVSCWAILDLEGTAEIHQLCPERANMKKGWSRINIALYMKKKKMLLVSHNISHHFMHLYFSLVQPIRTKSTLDSISRKWTLALFLIIYSPRGKNKNPVPASSYIFRATVSYMFLNVFVFRWRKLGDLRNVKQELRFPLSLSL